MAVGQRHDPIIFGLRDQSNFSVTSVNLNAAGTWRGYGFNLPVTETVNKIRIWVSNVTGSLGSTDVSMDIYSNNTASNQPNASLASSTTLTSAISAGSEAEFTGFSQSCTGGTQYWAVIKNLNGTPASNFPQIRHGTGADNFIRGSGAGYGWGVKGTVDSGTNWGTGNAASVVGIQIVCASGNVYGFIISAGGATPVGIGVYSARENGVKFTTPANVKLNLVGIGCRINITGSPTGNPYFRLYTGTTQTADTTQAVNAEVANNSYLELYFTSTQTLEPNTTYRFTLAESTQSDASGNRYNIGSFTLSNTSDSKAAMPLGSWVNTYYNAGFSDDDTTAIAMWGILDAATPFTATSTGSGTGAGFVF